MIEALTISCDLRNASGDQPPCKVCGTGPCVAEPYSDDVSPYLRRSLRTREQAMEDRSKQP